METFDYSQVPYNFGLCPSAGCPHALTCLRHIAFVHAPEKYDFLSTLNPAKLRSIKGDCGYYRSSKKMRYAKGFTCIVGQLAVRSLTPFRNRLISRYGRKSYYQFRKGDKLIQPADQRYIIRVAKELGLQLDDYFDGYVEQYYWGD